MRIEDDKLADLAYLAKITTTETLRMTLGVNHIEALIKYLHDNGFVNFSINHWKDEDGRPREPRLIEVIASRIIGIADREIIKNDHP